MRKATKPLLALVLFGAVAWVGYTVVWPALREDPATSAGPRAEKGLGLPPGFIRQVERADPVEAAELLRNGLDKYSGEARTELRELISRRAQETLRTTEAEVTRLLDGYRYATAVDLLERVRKAWHGTAIVAPLQDRVAQLRDEQAVLVAERKRDANKLFEAGRFEGAVETLRTKWEFEPEYKRQLVAHFEEIRRRIAAGTTATETPLPGPGPAPGKPEPVLAVLVAPPSLPGFPHPDVKRLAEARVEMARARKLFAAGRHQHAAKALAGVVGFYGDLTYVKRNREALAAMELLARYKLTGIKSLFNATSVKANGRRVTLRYTFATENEYLDWEEMRTIPHQVQGEFAPARSGVRGTGGTSYLMRGFFENNVTMTCKARIQQAKSHGLIFSQHDTETRQLMLLVTNHKIVEGENYVKARPGHSVLMWGKGTNRDVPLDSPDTAFLFKGPSTTTPSGAPGATLTLTFSVKGDNMVGTVFYKGAAGTLTFHTKGDDGRSIKMLRPGLFVLENGVLFSDIVIKGVLHKDFEKTRVQELLDLAETAE